MEFHTPGRPDDLPPFETLWARASALSVLEAAGAENGHEYVGPFVHHDDSGGNEWRLTRLEGGRGVLVGADHECDDHSSVEGFDPYAGPDWLPWDLLAELEDDREQGFAYWWDGARWDRIDYPDIIGNDGLNLLLKHLATRESALSRVMQHLDVPSGSDAWDEGAPRLDRVLQLAEERTGTEEQWRAVLDDAVVFIAKAQADSEYRFREPDECEAAPALEVAERCGLIAGTSPEELPAGKGRPDDWSWTPRPRW
ncbi:hypothetical protein IDM40_19255 [Nocardiopsis sp. HNM0947]|uniref:Uncharacterized protein n=1 Tax=Nocardiopsis coralli TaxID=2772213 RepID=A0ABR9PAE5_9ACTN|nr:hypothetical protein [Nocardiopsis coralli]MBE3000814.1 hypothetical protein [Nocardiopsis coralli]